MYNVTQYGNTIGGDILSFEGENFGVSQLSTYVKVYVDGVGECSNVQVISENMLECISPQGVGGLFYHVRVVANGITNDDDNLAFSFNSTLITMLHTHIHTHTHPHTRIHSFDLWFLFWFLFSFGFRF